MRDLDPAFAAHLKCGATTLCRCWKLTRSDGVALGFTDHDVEVVFDGTTFQPAAGFTGSEIPASLGLNVDTAEISGALVSPLLSDDDMNAGLYDGAAVDLYLVNWAAPLQRVQLESGTIGEITRQGKSFTAEVRSLSAALDQERGRLFQLNCDADLGDIRCGVDLMAAGNRANGTVDEILGERTFRVSGLASIAATRLQRGTIRMTSGLSNTLTFSVRSDRITDAGRIIELWRKPPRSLGVGDAFVATVGCDKSFQTCTQVFANAKNFRGFPHIPGSDFAMSYVSKDGDDNNGSALL